MSKLKTETHDDIMTESDEKIIEPPMFKVLMHNDDSTAKIFVVKVLMTFFNKDETAATQLMWHVHRNGTGVCGVYTFDVASTKVKAVKAYCRENGFSLTLSLEAE